MKIIERLFIELDKSGKKASELAEHLNVRKSVLSNWKSRGTNPPAEYIVPICEFLELDILYFLTGTVSKTLDDNSKEILNKDEQELIQNFRIMDSRDKVDLLDNARVKVNRQSKELESLTSCNGESNIIDNHVS